MKASSDDIVYYLLRGLFWPVALLPLPVLYVLADVIFWLVYSVVRYRRGLVDKNLRQCFPDKPDDERKAIRRQFYHNFADYIAETIKLLHISDREMLRRFTFGNLEAMTAPMSQGRSVVAYFSHCGNWEWAPSVILHCPEQVAAGDAFCQIYRPLRSKAMDRLMLHVRSRFGAVSLPKATSLRSFVSMRRNGTVSVTGFMSDQKPSHGDQIHVVEFLGRPTPVITGTEQLARRLGMCVVYWDMHKIARGHYRINIVPMADNAADTAEFQLTDSYFRLLETTIKRNPSIWLWTHNRWKQHIPDDVLAAFNHARLQQS